MDRSNCASVSQSSRRPQAPSRARFEVSSWTRLKLALAALPARSPVLPGHCFPPSFLHQKMRVFASDSQVLQVTSPREGTCLDIFGCLVCSSPLSTALVLVELMFVVYQGPRNRGRSWLFSFSFSYHSCYSYCTRSFACSIRVQSCTVSFSIHRVSRHETI